MSVEWTWITLVGTLVVGGFVYGLNWLDERKWSRDAERRATAEPDLTHPAE